MINNIDQTKKDLKKSKRFRKALATGLFISSIAVTGYLGNTFGVRQYIDDKASDLQNIIVERYSGDIGYRLDNITEEISSSESLDGYLENIQNLMYVANQKMDSETQVRTIENLIDDTSDAVKEHIIFNTYEKLSEESKNNMRWIIAVDSYNYGTERVGLFIEYISGLLVDGYLGIFGD